MYEIINELFPAGNGLPFGGVGMFIISLLHSFGPQSDRIS